MSYAITVGHLHFLPLDVTTVQTDCSCEDARHGCSPTYVFSIVGQISFRTALNHLAMCQKKECRSLRVRVMKGIRAKLDWLFNEESLLGCVLVQPYLFGAKRPIMKREHFPWVANHLASCPKETCAQLRRALLLTVREHVRPPVLPQEN